MLAQGLALTGSLGDLASLNFLSVEHRDRTGNPQQVLQCPKSVSYLTGQAGRQEIISKIPPSGAVRRNVPTGRRNCQAGVGGLACMPTFLLSLEQSWDTDANRNAILPGHLSNCSHVFNQKCC